MALTHALGSVGSITAQRCPPPTLLSALHLYLWKTLVLPRSPLRPLLWRQPQLHAAWSCAMGPPVVAAGAVPRRHGSGAQWGCMCVRPPSTPAQDEWWGSPGVGPPCRPLLVSPLGPPVWKPQPKNRLIPHNILPITTHSVWHLRSE